MEAPFHIHISPGDDAPLYRQIVRQVVEAIAAGRLVAGAQLPSIRVLGKKLVIAPLTVKKAYDELESQGLIEARRGQGTFVRRDAARSGVRAVERLRPLARRLLLEADLGGIDEAALLRLLDEQRKALREERDHQEEAI